MKIIAKCILIISFSLPSVLLADMEIYGYGTFLYNRFQTFKGPNFVDPIYREQIDISELAIEAEYIIDEKAEIEFEVEIEHGGVGNSMEFEPLEEFGEFETEVEKGGEITLSEIFYEREFYDYFKFRIGKFPLHIALGTILSNPKEHWSIKGSELEPRMLPASWNETGVQFEVSRYDVTFKMAVVNGLNSEFFRTYNWIGGGYQRHFESSNTANRAVFTQLEYGSLKFGRGVGISYYIGDTTGNRYKIGKINVPASVEIRSLMANWTQDRVQFTGQYITGSLENSDLVVTANNSLGGLAKPKSYGPLGHEARTSMVQIGYQLSDPLSIYIKEELVNTFEEVQGSITKNPRYDVKYRSSGFFWKIDKSAFLKMEYGVENTDLSELPETSKFKLNFGFDFDA